MAGTSEIPSNSVLPMNERFATASAPDRELARQERIASFESSKDGSEEPPILPREAWKSQLAFLKAILIAKRALDQIEKTAD